MTRDEAYLEKAVGRYAPEQGAAVFSLVVYPRWVRFFFPEGVAIDDPYVHGLMTQALKVAGADLKAGTGKVVLRSKISTSG